MKYAIVNDEKREAKYGLNGTCPICEVPVKPRCGRIRVPHWYHPPGSFDHHWEPETEWHRKWKDVFPKECQEVCHRAVDGERHLADVKTTHGHVLEFQNSPISEEERRSREAIYRPLYWVVNGLRLKGDRAKFFEALRFMQVLHANPLTVAVPTATCLPLRKWENSETLVLFDFGEAEEASDALRFGAPVLWAMRPGSPKGQAVLMPVGRVHFLDAMMKGKRLIGVQGVMPTARVPNFAIPLPLQRPNLVRMRWSGQGARGRGGWRF